MGSEKRRFPAHSELYRSKSKHSSAKTHADPSTLWRIPIQGRAHVERSTGVVGCRAETYSPPFGLGVRNRRSRPQIDEKLILYLYDQHLRRVSELVFVAQLRITTYGRAHLDRTSKILLP